MVIDAQLFVNETRLYYFYYSAPVGVQCIAINPSVCLSASISLESLGRSARNFVCRSPCGRGSVLLRRLCATLCTSGFMDDVTFGRNEREAGNGWQHSASAINDVRDRGGQSDVYECLFNSLLD